MPKFCGKCGIPIDEETGLCPNCDAKKLMALKEEKEKQIVYKKRFCTKCGGALDENGLCPNCNKDKIKTLTQDDETAEEVIVNKQQFCNKCGTPLDEETGLCPKCDRKKLKKLKNRVEEVEDEEEIEDEPKKEHRVLKIIGMVIGSLAIIVVVAIVVFMLLNNVLMKDSTETTSNEENVVEQQAEYTTISLLTDDSLSISFEGYDGEGSIESISLDNVEYDHDNADIASFIEAITLEYEDSTTLSNGDTLTIIASYDEEMAETFNLQIADASIDIEVSGLTVVYYDASEIPSSISDYVKEECINEVAEDFADGDGHSYTCTYHSMYFGSNGTINNYIFVIFKIEDYDSSTSSTSTYYIHYHVNDVYSTDGEREHIYYQTLRINNSKVTKESDIETALNNTYSGYTITKID
ncbi:MAG: hypothetical protein LUG12_02295 [Erysipelotrichaceae bacterium]|nr:hypothetical protein [Erysipelotrichaceae bacterium]